MGNPFGNIPWGSIQGNQQQEDPQQGFLQMILAALLSGGPPPQQPPQVQTPVQPAMGAPGQFAEEDRLFQEQWRQQQAAAAAAAGLQPPAILPKTDITEMQTGLPIDRANALSDLEYGRQAETKRVSDAAKRPPGPSAGIRGVVEGIGGIDREFQGAARELQDYMTIDEQDAEKSALQMLAEQLGGAAGSVANPLAWGNLATSLPGGQQAADVISGGASAIADFATRPIPREEITGQPEKPEEVFRWTDPNQVTEDFTAPSGERTFDQDVAAILSGAQTPTQAQELAPSEAGKQTVREVGSQGLAEDYAREQQKVSPEPDALAGSTDEAGETAFVNREIQLAQEDAEEYPAYRRGKKLPSRDEADKAIEDAITAMATAGPKEPEGQRLWETILQALLNGIMGAAAGNNWWQAIVGAGLYSGIGFLKKTQAWRAAKEQYQKDKDAYTVQTALNTAKLREAKWEGQRVVWDWAEQRRKDRLAHEVGEAVFREGKRATEATEELEADRTKAIREGTRTRAATTLAGQKITARGQAADIEYRKKLMEMTQVETRLNSRLKATQIARLQREGRQTGRTPAYSLAEQKTIQDMGQKGGPEYLNHVRTQVEMHRSREDAMLYVAEGMADRLAAVFGTEDAKGVEEEIQALVDKETGLDEKGRRQLALRLRTLRIYAAFMGNDGHAFLERAASGAAGVAGDPVARWVLEFALHSKWFERVR